MIPRTQISEAAVVGVTSEQWGQKVVAVAVLNPAHAQTGKGGKTWGAMDMRRALKDKLANYKIPQELKTVEEIPKNAMGKSTYFRSFNYFTLTTIQSTRRVSSRRYLESRLDPLLFWGSYIPILVQPSQISNSSPTVTPLSSHNVLAVTGSITRKLTDQLLGKPKTTWERTHRNTFLN